MSSHTNQTTRNRGTVKLARATCPVNWTVSGQRVVRDKGKNTCNKQGEVRSEGEGMEAIPPHPGLSSVLQGRPKTSIPDAGSQRG